MNRYKMFRRAHTAGDVFWWIFVVATLLAGGITWFGVDVYDDFGWTAYAPLTSQSQQYANYVPLARFGAIESVSAVSFCLLVLAALVEAVVVRRLVAGIVTVAVPFVAAALMWSALPRGHSSFSVETISALLGVLAAVAIRELWERRVARTVDRDEHARRV